MLITEITEADSQGNPNVTISPPDLRYLMEFSKIYKVGGIGSPYASIEWSGVQIPQALSAILKDRGLNIFLFNNDGALDTAPAYFFEQNLAGRGLDFDEFPDTKADFLRYAVQLDCINPVRGIIKCPLPSMEEIARGAAL